MALAWTFPFIHTTLQFHRYQPGNRLDSATSLVFGTLKASGTLADRNYTPSMGYSSGPTTHPLPHRFLADKLNLSIQVTSADDDRANWEPDVVSHQMTVE